MVIDRHPKNYQYSKDRNGEENREQEKSGEEKTQQESFRMELLSE